MTIATSTPRSRVSKISAAIASTVGRSIPYSRSPISASPESFRRTRWNLGTPCGAVIRAYELCSCVRLKRPVDAPDHEPRPWMGSGTQSEALELEHLGVFLGHGLRHRLRLVVDPRLVEQRAAALGEEALVHHPIDDLLARLLRLRLHLVRARVDLALGGHRLRGHVLPGDPARLRPGDVHREPAGGGGRAAADVHE